MLPEFSQRWPSPRHFLEAPVFDVVELCRSLGFANRRTISMKKMTEAYLAGGWQHAKELPGIGDYAAAAWEIFCQGTVPAEAPNDHALTQYWHWLKAHEKDSKTEGSST